MRNYRRSAAVAVNPQRFYAKFFEAMDRLRETESKPGLYSESFLRAALGSLQLRIHQPWKGLTPVVAPGSKPNVGIR